MIHLLDPKNGVKCASLTAVLGTDNRDLVTCNKCLGRLGWPLIVFLVVLTCSAGALLAMKLLHVF